MRQALLAAVLLAPLLATGRDRTTRAVLINGGHKPMSNYESHLVHMERMRDVLGERGIDSPVVFMSDGEDAGADMAVREPFEHPLRWLVEDTDAADRLPQTRLEDTPWQGPRQPATEAALSAWFAEPDVAPGDTLLLYTTDHGWRDKETDTAGLWLWREKSAPETMGQWLDALPDGVTTVMVMSHCYSGAYAEVVLSGRLDGSVCGFFSAPRSRQAYGCYPEGRSSTTIGHGFRFTDALAEAGSAQEAHERVLLTDRTPDVPLSTSDLYLHQLVEAEAERRGESLSRTVVSLLSSTPPDPLIAQMAEGVGLSAPESYMAALAMKKMLAEAEEVVSFNDKLWSARLEALAAANVDAILSSEDARAADAAALIELLQANAETIGAWPVLEAAAERQQIADDIRWRMSVREAVALRIEARFVAQAGEALLKSWGKRADRKTLRRLRRCEAAPLGKPAGQAPPLPAPWPSLQDDVTASARPSYLGVGLQEVDDEPGAVRVTSVLPDTPAMAAGLRGGDVLLGEPDALFVLPGQARAWAALLPRETPVSILIRRDGVPMTLSLTPGAFPEPE